MSSSKILRKTLAQPCEKALDGSCKYATKKCFEAVPYQPDMDRSIPARRWIDCWGWAATLKMHFDERSGRWVYLSEETRRELDKLKLNSDESYDEVVRRLLTGIYIPIKKKRYQMLILTALKDGRKRFKDLLEITGLNRVTLANHLKELLRNGKVKKEVASNDKRVRYYSLKGVENAQI